jgi:hypothetical protein
MLAQQPNQESLFKIVHIFYSGRGAVQSKIFRQGFVIDLLARIVDYVVRDGAEYLGMANFESTRDIL